MSDLPSKLLKCDPYTPRTVENAAYTMLLLMEAAARIEELDKEIEDIEGGTDFYGICPDCGCGGPNG